MTQLNFTSAEALRDFYLSQNYFAIYYCITESADVDIEHFNLLKSGHTPDVYCYNSEILDLHDDRALDVLRHFLQTGQTVIYPSRFFI